MDNGLIFWPKDLDFEYFSICPNNLHPPIKYTFEKAKLFQTDYYKNLPSIEIFGHWRYFTL